MQFRWSWLHPGLGGEVDPEYIYNYIYICIIIWLYTPLKTNMFHPRIFICEKEHSEPSTSMTLGSKWLQTVSFSPKGRAPNSNTSGGISISIHGLAALCGSGKLGKLAFFKGKESCWKYYCTLPKNEHFERPKSWRWMVQGIFLFKQVNHDKFSGAPKGYFIFPPLIFSIFQGAFVVSFREGIFDKGSCLILGKV